MITTPEEREAVVTISLMAAFADGSKQDAERERLKDVFESLDTSFTPSLYERVLMGEATPEEEAQKLQSPMLRTLAYEMAVGVCDADGLTNAAERQFLDQLSAALSLESDTAQEIDQEAERLMTMPLESSDPAVAPEETFSTTQLPPVPHLPPLPTSPPSGKTESSEIDQMILRYSVLNGGLELLPQTLATMAVVPLQTKMVYRIGRRYGYQLDRGHIMEFLATVGIGMTSQVLETYARKMVGGLFDKPSKRRKGKGKKQKDKKGKGKKVKEKSKLSTVAATATGAAMSFASTWALGQVAKSYYAGGRTLPTQSLKELFTRQVDQGRLLYEQHRHDVEVSAETTDLRSLLAEARLTSQP